MQNASATHRCWSMRPSFLNRFIKKRLTRDRVVLIISAAITCFTRSKFFHFVQRCSKLDRHLTDAVVGCFLDLLFRTAMGYRCWCWAI